MGRASGGTLPGSMDGRRVLRVALQYFIAQSSAREDGQGLAEYGLILSVIAILAMLALIFLGGHIEDILGTAGNAS